MTDHKTTPCKACGAPVIWIKDQNGTKLPLNKQQVRAYRQAIDDSWGFDYAWGSGARKKPTLVYIAHSLTCTGASEFSQGRKK